MLSTIPGRCRSGEAAHWPAGIVCHRAVNFDLGVVVAARQVAFSSNVLHSNGGGYFLDPIGNDVPVAANFGPGQGRANSVTIGSIEVLRNRRCVRQAAGDVSVQSLRHKLLPVVNPIFFAGKVEHAAAVVVAIGRLPHALKVSPQQVADLAGVRVNAKLKKLPFDQRVTADIQVEKSVHRGHQRLRAVDPVWVAACGQLIE